MNDPICTHLDRNPKIHDEAWLAPGVVIVGDVTVESQASIWFQCVLRADIQSIKIGPGTNIQDGTVIHLSSELGTVVGSYTTVGHKALLHACEVEDEVLVGMGAIIMDGARIGARSIVGAGALVTGGTIIPPGSMVVGSPAKVVRSLDLKEQKSIRSWAEKYIQVTAEHRARELES